MTTTVAPPLSREEPYSAPFYSALARSPKMPKTKTFPACWKEGEKWVVGCKSETSSKKQVSFRVSAPVAAALAKSAKQRLMLFLENAWGMEAFYRSETYRELQKGEVEKIFSLAAKHGIEV